MQVNIGSVDRVVRISFSVVIGILYFANVLSGTFALLLGVGAIIFLATGSAGMCPLYSLCGISTKQSKNGGK